MSFVVWHRNESADLAHCETRANVDVQDVANYEPLWNCQPVVHTLNRTHTNQGIRHKHHRQDAEVELFECSAKLPNDVCEVNYIVEHLQAR